MTQSDNQNAQPESSQSDANAAGTLARFARLPKRFAGRRAAVTCEVQEQFALAYGRLCVALDLPLGETVRAHAKIEPGGQQFDLLATGPTAETLLEYAKGSRLRAEVRTCFGIDREIMYGPDGSVEEQSAVTGLLIINLLDVSTPE